MKDFGIWFFITAMVALATFEREVRCHLGNELACDTIRRPAAQGRP